MCTVNRPSSAPNLKTYYRLYLISYKGEFALNFNSSMWQGVACESLDHLEIVPVLPALYNCFTLYRFIGGRYTLWEDKMTSFCLAKKCENIFFCHIFFSL